MLWLSQFFCIPSSIRTQGYSFPLQRRILFSIKTLIPELCASSKSSIVSLVPFYVLRLNAIQCRTNSKWSPEQFPLMSYRHGSTTEGIPWMMQLTSRVITTSKLLPSTCVSCSSQTLYKKVNIELSRELANVYVRRINKLEDYVLQSTAWEAVNNNGKSALQIRIIISDIIWINIKERPKRSDYLSFAEQWSTRRAQNV